MATTATSSPSSSSSATGLRSSAVLTALYGLGMALVFVGERLFSVGKGRAVATGLGLALVVAALVLRAVRIGAARGEARRIETTIACLTITVIN